MAFTPSVEISHPGTVAERMFGNRIYAPDCACSWWWSKGETMNNVPLKPKSQQQTLALPPKGRTEYMLEPFRVLFRKGRKGIAAVISDTEVPFDVTSLGAPVVVVGDQWVPAAYQIAELVGFTDAEWYELEKRTEMNVNHIHHIGGPVSSMLGRLLPPPYVMIDIDVAMIRDADVVALIEVKTGGYDKLDAFTTGMTYEVSKLMGVTALGLDLSGQLYVNKTGKRLVDTGIAVARNRWFRAPEEFMLDMQAKVE
jgi:hypothetical protein